MTHLLKSVTLKHYPVLTLEFRDGLVGDLDLTDTIARGKMFEPLKDEKFFSGVKMAPDGYSFGWRLDETGNELDFSAEGAHIDIETTKVIALAEQYRAKIQAAE
jgi:Protein of unknown function (DUF2442)